MMLQGYVLIIPWIHDDKLFVLLDREMVGKHLKVMVELFKDEFGSLFRDLKDM